MSAGFTDDALRTRQAQALRGFVEMLASGGQGAGTIALDGGVLGVATPAVPHLSLPNSVVYDDTDALVAGLPALAEFYDDAGVDAWTVWLRPGDERAAEALAAAGHALDGQPGLMAAGLDELPLEQRVELDLDPDPEWRVVGELNDAAYGIRGLATGTAEISDPVAVRYVARVDGEPVSCAVARAHEGNCGIFCVATLPSARGRGLASELMRQGLRDALAAGATTATLEASKMGEPVYTGMGYRLLGRLEMWERRRIPQPA